LIVIKQIEDSFLDINRELWNERTELHYKSDFYGINDFIAGKSSLNSIELDLLGDVKGLKVLHLQCHFGQDSISLSRLGAEVVGIDFSDKAIEHARDLALQTSSDARFICADIYSLSSISEKSYNVKI